MARPRGRTGANLSAGRQSDADVPSAEAARLSANARHPEWSPPIRLVMVSWLPASLIWAVAGVRPAGIGKLLLLRRNQLGFRGLLGGDFLLLQLIRVVRLRLLL